MNEITMEFLSAMGILTKKYDQQGIFSGKEFHSVVYQSNESSDVFILTVQKVQDGIMGINLPSLPPISEGAH